MSDYPFGGTVEDSRRWLDNNGFGGKFTGWNAAALLFKSDEYIKSKFPGETEADRDNAERLCGLLSTAREYRPKGTAEEEGSRKRRKSIEQTTKILAEYPEFGEEYFSMVKAHTETLHENSKLLKQVTALSETIRVYATVGNETVVRSLYEVVIQKMKNDAWYWIHHLHSHLRGASSSNLDLLASLPPDPELLTITADESKSQYHYACQMAIFMRSLSGLSTKDKNSQWRAKFAESVNVVTELDNCVKVNEQDVRIALASIYAKLSDQIHQIGARFSLDGSFTLPRADDRYSFPEIYAFATIVREAGLTPAYPSPQALVASESTDVANADG